MSGVFRVHPYTETHTCLMSSRSFSMSLSPILGIPDGAGGKVCIKAKNPNLDKILQLIRGREVHTHYLVPTI